MKIRHAILIALFALLQGLAPLLHAHMGVDRSGASGVHMHAGLHVRSEADGLARFSDIGPPETPVVGLGQEIRRDLGWQPVDVAGGAAPVIAGISGARHEAPRHGRERTALRALRHLLPPAHGPPPATA